LHRRLIEKSLLQRMQVIALGEAFNRRDLLLTDRAYLGDA
jgi:hypothetical protein